jgi:hypothetical protein
MIDASPNFVKNSNVNPKVKTVEEGIEVRSLIHNTSRVKKACWSFRMGTKMNDKWVNYSHRLAQIKQQVG